VVTNIFAEPATFIIRVEVNMGAANLSLAVVTIYHIIQYHNPEDKL